MIHKEHLKIRLRKFLEEKDMRTAPGLCVYLVRFMGEGQDNYDTCNFLRDWFEPHRKPGSGYVSDPYKVDDTRLTLAQKLLDELEESDISDGTPTDPDIN